MTDVLRLLKRQEAARASEQDHYKKRQQEAKEQTDRVRREKAALDKVLSSVLSARPKTFDSLIESGQDRPAPEPADYLLKEPGAVRKLILHLPVVAERYEHEKRAAQDKYENAKKAYEKEEAGRRAGIEERRDKFAAGDRETVQSFISEVLLSSEYPKGFPCQVRVSYQPGRATVAVDLELPPPRIVPRVSEYRYEEQSDKIKPVPIPVEDIKRQYTRLIARVALRAIYEVFSATSPYLGVVGEVALTGWSARREGATGKESRAQLLSVPAEHNKFSDLQLACVQPEECLTHLDGQISPDPYGLVPVERVQPFPED
jgi:restriction system protein